MGFLINNFKKHFNHKNIQLFLLCLISVSLFKIAIWGISTHSKVYTFVGRTSLSEEKIGEHFIIDGVIDIE